MLPRLCRSAAWLCVVLLRATALGADTPAPLLSPARVDEWEFIAPEKTPLASVVHFNAAGEAELTGKPVGYLQTRTEHRNYQLHLEWRWSGQPGNAGVLLHIASGAIDRNLWPLSLQVQTKQGRAGDLLPMAGAKFAEPLTSPPDARTPQLDRKNASSEKPAGEWNACDIVCRDGAIDVTINGVIQNQISGAQPDRGRIGFQFEGAPYVLRNVTLTPLP